MKSKDQTVKRIIFALILETWNIEISNTEELSFVVESLGNPNAWHYLRKEIKKKKMVIGVKKSPFGDYTYYNFPEKKSPPHKLLTFKQFKHLVSFAPEFIQMRWEIYNILETGKVTKDIIDNLKSIFTWEN